MYNFYLRIPKEIDKIEWATGDFYYIPAYTVVVFPDSYVLCTDVGVQANGVYSLACFLWYIIVSIWFLSLCA